MTVGWRQLPEFKRPRNEKLPKPDYQSKHCTIRVEHRRQNIQLPQRPSPWRRGWDVLAFEYQLYFISICLLMKQCSRVGLPVEQPFTWWSCDFWCSRSATDFNCLSNSLNETKNSLAWNVYSFQGEFRYLRVTDRWKWEFRTAITLLDFSDLSEILLENIINIIKTLSLALSCSWKPITNSIPLKKKKKALELTADIRSISVRYHQTDIRCIIWNPMS